MSDKVRVAIFISVVVSLSVGIHGYIWLRLVRDTALGGNWRKAATLTLISLMIGMVGSLFLRRTLPLELGRIVLHPLLLWMGMLFLLFVALVWTDLAKLVVRLYGFVATSGAEPADPGRRLFFARLIGGTIAGGTAALTLFGSRTAMALSALRVERVEVTLKRLPRSLDGFRIVQISDLHIGPTLGRHWLAGVVDRVNRLKPDLVAITGDLVDGSVSQLQTEVAPLAALKARYGSYFCTGNHEYYSGATSWCAHLPQATGVRVLRNERVSIGEGEASFDLVGVDDYNARGHAPGHGAALSRALKGREVQRECVLLAHQPRQVDEAADHGVGLQLSGHTHGGQIWPWNYLVKLQQPYVKGLVDHRGTQLYINQGTGFWGPPLRLGTYSEITEITLRSAKG